MLSRRAVCSRASRHCTGWDSSSTRLPSAATVPSLLRSAEGLTPVKASADGTELHLDNGQFTIGADGKTIVKLYYDRSSCTLTFNSMGGSMVKAISTNAGEDITGAA